MAKKPDTAPKAGDNASATPPGPDAANAALAQATNAETSAGAQPPASRKRKVDDERREFTAASPLDYDNELYGVGDTVALTFKDFTALKAAGVLRQGAAWD